MDKIYVFYLMCTGISLIFLSTYFSWAFPEYTNSVFYIVNIMLLSSIFLISLLKGVKAFANKLIIFSFFLLLVYFGIVIAENLFNLTIFGSEVLRVFSNFFFISSTILMLLCSFVVNEKSDFINKKNLVIIFSPIILYSLWVVFNKELLLSQNLMDSFLFRFSLLFFTLVYSFVSFYNMMSVAIKALAVRQKFFFLIFGITILLLSTGFRQSEFLFELTPIFSVIGSFMVSFGLMAESSLNLHNKVLNDIFNSLNKKKRKEFKQYLEGVLNRRELLKARVWEDRVKLVDNFNLSNVEEKKMYHKVVLCAYKWYRKNVKKHSKFLKRSKKFYNNQVVLAKKLSMFFV